jgi:hypothetical protein
MRLIEFLLSAALATITLACGAAEAQPVTVKAGHTVLTLPAGMQAYSAPLSQRFTGGDPVRIDRLVVVLSPGKRPPVAALLIESTREAGRYIWTESCKQLRNDAHTFVHSPFHAMGNECALAVGPVDLAAVIGQSFPDVERTLRSGDRPVPEGVGYVVKSTYASSSGSMLSITVLVREPFVHLSTAPDALPDDTGVPASVVAWTRALNDQVRGAMRSFAGAWQLPPMDERPREELPVAAQPSQPLIRLASASRLMP